MPTNFVWKVHSTISFGGSRPSGVYWTWDHVSFAFNFYQTSNLIIQPKRCTITTKEATGYRPASRADASRTADQCVANEDLINQLERKIQADL